jgi:hypothetical protein
MCGCAALAVANCDGFLLERLTLSCSQRGWIRLRSFPFFDYGNRAEVSSQRLIYGKFPQMQEDFCEFLLEVSGGRLEPNGLI